MHVSSVQPFLSCESRYVGSRWQRSWIPSNFFLRHLLVHCGLWNALSVPQLCRAEHYEVAPFLWCSSRLRKRPIAMDENVGWVHFLSRDVHKCNRSFLDSNREDIEKIALSELFRTTQIPLHCLFHESLLSNCQWMGCRCYFAASRLEVLLDEDDSRSSSRVREHGSFLLASQLHGAIQTLWCQCLCPRTVWTNQVVVHKQVSLFYIQWSASTFSSASLSWSERLTDTGTQLENWSPCFFHGYNKLEACRKDDCVRSCFDRT